MKILILLFTHILVLAYACDVKDRDNCCNKAQNDPCCKDLSKCPSYIYAYPLLNRAPPVNSGFPPLRTRENQILDSKNSLVNLRGIAWTAHGDKLLFDGLDKQPISKILHLLQTYGFNFIRITTTDDLFYNHANTKASAYIDPYSWSEALRLNPWLKSCKTKLDAFNFVIKSINARKIYFNVDSTAQMVNGSSTIDQNFDKKDFDRTKWLTSLKNRAKISKDVPYFIGITEVQRINPNLLCFIGGLAYDETFQNLKTIPFYNNWLKSNKIVLEMHWYKNWYAWNLNQYPDRWSSFDSNDLKGFCSSVESTISRLIISPTSRKFPIFVGEIGVPYSNLNFEEKHFRKVTAKKANMNFMNCAFDIINKNNFHAAYWHLSGSWSYNGRKTSAVFGFGFLDRTLSSARSAYSVYLMSGRSINTNVTQLVRFLTSRVNPYGK